MMNEQTQIRDLQKRLELTERDRDAIAEEFRAWMHEHYPEPEPIYDEDGEWVNYDEFMQDAPFSVFVARMIHSGASYDNQGGIWYSDTAKPGILISLERQLALADRLAELINGDGTTDDADALVAARDAFYERRELTANGANALVWPQPRRETVT